MLSVNNKSWEKAFFGNLKTDFKSEFNIQFFILVTELGKMKSAKENYYKKVHL